MLSEEQIQEIADRQYRAAGNHSEDVFIEIIDRNDRKEKQNTPKIKNKKKRHHKKKRKKRNKNKSKSENKSKNNCE
ncbi:MAG: hypothetical protein JSW07_05950 [bacterium]|nr:MAG: hypothetical protein JSW07_05950 [bacterium]